MHDLCLLIYFNIQLQNRDYKFRTGKLRSSHTAANSLPPSPLIEALVLLFMKQIQALPFDGIKTRRIRQKPELKDTGTEVDSELPTESDSKIRD